MPNAKPMTIGVLAQETGTKVVTIRYYEQIRLLPPPRRTAGNYRVYDEAHLRRLRFIRRGRALGFTLEQVRELVELAVHRDWDCAQADRIAMQHLAAIEEKIADLRLLAAELRGLGPRCDGGTVADCRIIEALSPAAPGAAPGAPARAGL